jgi:hypothetical protein
MPPVTDRGYEVFRPHRSRIVSVCAAVAVVLCFIALAIWVPRGGATGFTTGDSLLSVAFGLVIAAFLLRYSVIKAVPTRSGLKVQNLISTREVPWQDVVNVQFGGGQAWLVLELIDTDHLAVMAIQRSDGPRAEAEAGRLAALVQANSQVDRDN